MNEKPHKVLDHSILGYFVLFVFAEVLSNLGSNIIDEAVAPYIPGYSTEITVFGMTMTIASGFGSAIGALVAILIFVFWFKPDYKEAFTRKAFKKGLIMLLPFLFIHYVGSVVSWYAFGINSVLLAFLKAFAPGFSEETAFRILGISNYMRTIKSEDSIKKIFWLSSVFFGLSHMANMLGGADPFASVFQALYCIGVGMILGAVYLRTGNAWIVILGHMSLDFFELCRGDTGARGGLMLGVGVGDWITMVAAIAGAVIALRFLDKKYYPEIMQLWNRKWNRETPSSID